MADTAATIAARWAVYAKSITADVAAMQGLKPPAAVLTVAKRVGSYAAALATDAATIASLVRPAPSKAGSIVVGSTGQLIDKNGNARQITTGGQISSTSPAGVVTIDAATNNVTTLAIDTGGNFWQLNTSKNWYEETAPLVWSAATKAVPPGVTLPAPPTPAPVPVPVPAPTPMPTGKYLRGSNDHFLAQGTLGLSMQARIQRAVTLGLNSIRVDTYNSTHIQPFVSAAKQYAAAGIELIPTLLPDISSAKVEQDAYNIGLAYGSAFAAASKGIYVNQKLELGNEEDLTCQNGKDGSGGPWPQDYDDTKYALIRGKLRGLYDGVKKGDPNCVAMIGNSGWQATGFTDRLYADGVRWDVLIIHDYDAFGQIDVPINSGPVINRTFIDYYASQPYGVQIFLSEIGDDQNPNGSAAQAQAMLTVISKVEALSKKYPIIGWAEYELFDYSDGDWSMLCDHSGNPLPAYSVLQTYIAQTAPPSAAQSPAPAPAPAPVPVVPPPAPAPAPPPAPAPAPVPALAMSLVSPAGDATPLGGTIPLVFAGTGMENVEAFIGGKMVDRAVCASDGTGAIGNVDLSIYPDGPLTISSNAWPVPAGQSTTAAPVTKSITIQVKNAIPVPPPAPAPAPVPSAAGGRNVLVAFYDAPSDVASWLGYPPDATINNSFQDSGLGQSVEIIAGTKVIVALDLGASHYNATPADYQAGAAGQNDAAYEATVKSLLPRAADIIAFRIDPEFNLHGQGAGAAWQTAYTVVGPVIYIACWNSLAKFIRQYFPGIPIFFNPNVENGADVTPYWPGGKDVHMGIDAYMAPQWNTTFAHYVGVSVNGLQVLHDFAAKQGAQTFMCEWGDLYPDAAGDLGQMAAWMLANTAGGAYWDSNDALNTTGAGNTSPVLTDAVKKAEFQAAFGGLGPYTGTLFKL